MVVDFHSFQRWYHRYLEKLLDKQRNLDKRSRLLLFAKHSSPNSQFSSSAIILMGFIKKMGFRYDHDDTVKLLLDNKASVNAQAEQVWR